MHISVPYGQKELEIEVSDDVQGIVVADAQGRDANPIELALAAPIGTPPLREIVQSGQSVAIVISDITRPCPSHLMLPPVVDELMSAGVNEEDVTVVFGIGVHRKQTAEERAKLVGPEIADRLLCIDSDPSKGVYVGTTTRGTPIEAFEPVVRADLRIALGNVAPHYFAGYSGGAKALVPGVCTGTTITHNHAMMLEDSARLGVLDGNPVREDLEEGAALIGLDFILNVILDSSHGVISAAAGHPIEAHRWACRILNYQRGVRVKELADIVIVSAGGYPKDINLYQAQKALDNAAMTVRPGGIIIWVAECSEGMGNAVFTKWLTEYCVDEIEDRLHTRFVLGGHKAAAIAKVLRRATLILISDLAPELVEACDMIPCSDREAALQMALAEVGPDPRVLVLPEGASVIMSVA